MICRTICKDTYYLLQYKVCEGHAYHTALSCMYDTAGTHHHVGLIIGPSITHVIRTRAGSFLSLV